MTETFTTTLLSTTITNDQPDEVMEMDVDTLITYASLQNDLNKLVIRPRKMLVEKLMAYSELL